jgi:uncharacterized Zn finger protein (UPF0148 family)
MEDFESGDGKVSCAVCGKRFKIITPRHLKQHNLTLKDYKNRYPNSPISGDLFSVSTKYGKTNIFKNNNKDIKSNNPIIEDRIEEDDDEILDDNVERYPEIEEMLQSEVIFEPIPKDKHGKEKVTILNLIRSYFPKVQMDFFIRKNDMQNHLEFEYISDFADPVGKVLFDFPRMFWHNNSVTNRIRNIRLQKEGWRIFTFSFSNLNIEGIKNELEKMYY